MSRIPREVKNRKLYVALLNLSRSTFSKYGDLVNELIKVNVLRKNFAFDPFLSSMKKTPAGSVLKRSIHKDELLLFDIVEFVIDGLFEELESTNEYNECVKVIDSDPLLENQVNKIHRISGTIQTMRHWTYVSHVLKRILFRYLIEKKLKLTSFNKIYSQLENFLYSEYLEYSQICPLRNFRHDGSVQFPIKINDSIQIRTLSAEEKIKLSQYFLPDIHSDSIDFIIEYKFNVKKGFDISFEEQSRCFPNDSINIYWAIVTLFRFVGVDMAILENITTQLLDIPTAKWTLNLFVSSLGVAYGSIKYLDAKTLSRFMHLWIRFGKSLSSGIFDFKRFDGDPFANLKISLNRFNDAYERKDGEDAFIDNIVALEALFSKEDDNFLGVTVRLSRRIALFLEKDPRKRKKIFCELVKLYDSRGKLVHGGHTEEIDIVKTRTYLVRSYLKYFRFLKSKRFSHSDFIKSLDSSSRGYKIKRKNCR